MTDRILNNPALIELYKSGRTAEATIKSLGTYLLGAALGALVVIGLIALVVALCWPTMYWIARLVGCPYIWH